MVEPAPFISSYDLETQPWFAYADDRKSIWGAAYRQYNLGSALDRKINRHLFHNYDEEDGYDPFKDPGLKPYEGIMHKFLTSKSSAESRYRLKQHLKDQEDLALLDISNSGAAEFFNMIADPAILAPLAPAKVLRMSSGLDRFVYGGAFSAAIMAPTELIKQSELQNHTLGHTAVALTGATLVGGTLTKILGKPQPHLATHANKQIYRSAGSAVSPERAREAGRALMEGDALAETGIGAEKLGWNPVIRMLKSENYLVRSLAAGMVDMGGMIQKKVRTGEAQEQSVESIFRTKYYYPLIQAIRESDEAYLSYRGINAKEGDISRSTQMLGVAAKDLFGRSHTFMSEVDFRIRVGKAMRNGDIDEMNDLATPFVNKAAAAGRKQFELIAKEGMEVDLFARQINASIRAAEAAGDAKKVAKLKTDLARLQKEGLTVNTAKSYLPRVFRVDRILENQDEFIRIVSGWAARHYRVDSAEANKIAKEIMDEVTRSKPFYDLDDAAQLEWITLPSAAKSRTFEIDDKLIEEFLESDFEVLMRHHTKTMGIDIELTRKFGDIDMRNIIDDVTEEYQKLIDDAAVADKPISDRLFFNLKTGISTTLKVFRGSGGSGKVAFARNVLGDGVYFGRNKKVASNYGSDVKEHIIHLKNPFVIKTDADLLKLFDDAGFNSTAIKNAADEVKRLAASVRDYQKTKPSIDDYKKFSDDFALKFEKAINDLTNLRRTALMMVSPYLKKQGHDGVVVSFKAPNFNQLTKGDLTVSKLVRETNFDAKGEYLLKQTFSHDQVYVFGKNIEDYEKAVPKKDSLETRRKLKKALENDIRDIRGLRDRLRGTYGASKDPHAMQSRFVRAMKSFNVLVGMGGAVASSVPDIARIVMVEGLQATHDKGLRHLFKSSSSIIKQMKKREMRQTGVAADAILGLRAAAFSDVGDLFGARFGIERRLNQSVSTFFMLNGLNYWNQVLKEWAGGVTMLRMTQAIMTDWSKLSRVDQEKFLRNGIDQNDHMQMQTLIKQHGKKVDGEWMPNTADWADGPIRLKFRVALNQSVERTIVTPGAGDRALWTSTELGSLMTQFKSYGQGAMVRVLTAGLQEKDAAFWQGAILMVGLASLVNEFKRMQYGIEGEQDYDEKLVDAIDRSGVLGWFADVNNAVEKISDFNLGARPTFTDRPAFPMHEAAKGSALFGPTISNLSNLGSVAGDVLTGNVDAGTGKTARFITPYSNIPYMDPAFDVIQQGIFGEQ